MIGLQSVTRTGISAILILVVGLCATEVVNSIALAEELAIDWREVPNESKIPTLRIIGDQFKGNYERLTNWQGICIVDMQESLSKEYVAEAFQDSLKNAMPLLKQSQFEVRFVIDFPSASIYLSKKTTATRFLSQATMKEVQISNFIPLDESSILTSEHYLHMRPELVWPGFGVLPGHPEARQKRAAFRDPTQHGERKNFGDLVDPRDFFGFGSRDRTFGQLLEGIVHGLEANERRKCILYKGETNGAQLYRIVAEYKSSTSPLYLISTCNSATGYNPTSMVFAVQEDGEQPVNDMYLSWSHEDGIFVPSHVKQSRYLQDGNIAYQRQVKIEKQLLNQPLDPHQFDYQGLVSWLGVQVESEGLIL